MQRIVIKENSPWKEAVGKTGVIRTKIKISNAGDIYLVDFDDKDLNRYQSKRFGGFSFKEDEFEALKY